MTYGDPTTLEDILSSITNQLVTTSAVLAAERVIITMADAEFFDGDPPGDQFLTIAPATFRADEGLVTGGGVLGTNGTLSISLWSRFEVDWASADADALQDQTNGILAKWRTVLASLQLFAPTDESGNCILEEPMRVINWSVRPRHRAPWLVIDSSWDARFVQELGS
jgi:hypothetical protein